MKFSDLAKVFDLISQNKARLRITEILADLYLQVSPEEAYMVTYLSLGYLKPSYQNSQFNFAEKSVEKVIAQLLNVDQAQFKNAMTKSGDMGLALLSLPWSYQDEGLEISTIYEQLSLLQQTGGTGSQEEKAGILVNLLNRVDALSASYIVRTILGKMRLGFSDMTIIDALSWMVTSDKSLRKEIENAYNLSADLGIIAQKLKEQGIEGLRLVKPTLGIPIRPAAAERMCTPEEIISKIGACVAQPKLDGFRLQIHIQNKDGETKVWFFSRNLIDMSNMFPDLVKALLGFPVQNVIMEGEAISYDEETNTFLPFQETVKRKRKHNLEEYVESVPLRLFVFDVLYLNNQPLIELSYLERRRLAAECFGQYALTAITLIDEKLCTTIDELDTYFKSEVAQGLEGLVVKRPESVYQPGKRNFNWIKLKRVFKGHLQDTLDCVVLGYYFGKGRRVSFGIGAFLVGIYNKEKDVFETVAKVGTGLFDEEWRELRHKCEEFRVAEQPSNVICSAALRPDVWVLPNIVTIIVADEITQSPMHTAGKNDNLTGYALRFPRFVGYSLDKHADQATTIDELVKFYKSQFKEQQLEQIGDEFCEPTELEKTKNGIN